MSVALFHVLHLFSLFFLVGILMAALAAPLPENRRKFLKWSGISAGVVALTGFGMLGMMQLGWPGWALVKIVCWLIIAGMVGQPFRHPEKAREMTFLSAGVIALALLMVYFKPF